VGSGAENHSDSSYLEEKESHTAEHSRQEDEIAVCGERCANISPCAKSATFEVVGDECKDPLRDSL